MQISNIIDTSIKHPISGQSTPMVKRFMYLLRAFLSSANFFRNFPRWKSVVCIQSDMHILRFYFVGQKTYMIWSIWSNKMSHMLSRIIWRTNYVLFLFSSKWSSIGITSRFPTLMSFLQNKLQSTNRTSIQASRWLKSYILSLGGKNLLCAFGPWIWIQSETSDESL